MEIVCINNKNYKGVGAGADLTIGKTYATDDHHEALSYFIEGDSGVICEFDTRRFITLEEHTQMERVRKLKTLLV